MALEWLPDVFEDRKPPVIRAIDGLALLFLGSILLSLVGWGIFAVITAISLAQGLIGGGIILVVASFIWIALRADGAI